MVMGFATASVLFLVYVMYCFLQLRGYLDMPRK